MMNFFAGLIVGVLIATYGAVAYPQQLHSAVAGVGLQSLMPSADQMKAPTAPVTPPKT